jgi:hypothetical protein
MKDGEGRKGAFMRAKVLAVISAFCMACAVQAADLVKLEWGPFVVESDSSGKRKSWSAAPAPDGMTLSFLFDGLVAQPKSAGEALANLSGYFDIDQPASIKTDIMKVDLRGHISKTRGSSARLDVAVGPLRKTFDWPRDMEKSEDFTVSLETPIAGGMLPDPFPIAAVAQARADTAQDNVLVTLDSIDLSVGAN